MKVEYKELFYRTARGPEIQKVNWSELGVTLESIDYYNPDDVYNRESLKTVIFKNSQVYVCTPHEVIGDNQINDEFYDLNPSALINLGKSSWLKQFNQMHLESCNHYQLHFYDDLFDVICENVQCKLKYE